MKPNRYMLMALALLLSSGNMCQANGVPAKNYNGVMIYQVPFGEKIETTKVKLYPHYMVLRKEQGWTYAFIDVGYKLTNPIMLEDIPGKANRLVGRKTFGEKSFIILKGKGYTEIRKEGLTPVKKIYWERGDTFIAPHGYWVGHANPNEEAARILTLSINLTNDILNPDIIMESGQPTPPYLLHILPNEHDDIYAGEIKVAANELLKNESLSALIGDHNGYTIYRTTWGTTVNLRKVETGISPIPLRGQAGWKSAHLELGGKIFNHSIIQDISPKTKEIGHKHGHEVIFLGIEGNGRINIREEINSSPIKIDWKEDDLFCLPWYPKRTWHAHSNESGQSARIFASVHHLGFRDEMLNPYLGQIKRGYKQAERRFKDQRYKDHIFD